MKSSPLFDSTVVGLFVFVFFVAVGPKVVLSGACRTGASSAIVEVGVAVGAGYTGADEFRLHGAGDACDWLLIFLHIIRS